MKSERIELFSPLSPADCAIRIAAVMDRGFSMAAIFGDQPLIGSVTETSLRVCKRVERRNSFQKHLIATLRREGSGTAISGEIRESLYTKNFVRYWPFAVVVFGFIQTANAGQASAEPHKTGSIFAIAYLIIFLLSLGIFWICRRTACDESRFLADFLVKTLEIETAPQ